MKETFDFISLIAREHPVAFSLVPMAFGFLLLAWELSRKTVRKTATNLIWGFLGISGALVVFAFIFSFVQTRGERAELVAQVEELKRQVGKATQERDESTRAETAAKLLSESTANRLKEAEVEVGRQKARAEEATRTISQTDVYRVRQLRETLVTVRAIAMSMLQTLHTKGQSEALGNPMMQSIMRNLTDNATNICERVSRELILPAAAFSDCQRMR